MADKILSQGEIDALLGSQPEKEKGLPERGSTLDKTLSAEERDALGEVGNISLGAAATTLSLLLGQKASISSPRVVVCSPEELKEMFDFPGVTVNVEFTAGLQGFNVLVLKQADVLVMADLMMDEEGKIKKGEDRELTEMEISAVAEIMNQMIGAAATSLAELFGFTVRISPPGVGFFQDRVLPGILAQQDSLVVVFFRLTIGDFLDSEFMQIMNVKAAHEQAAILLKKYGQDQRETPEALPDKISEYAPTESKTKKEVVLKDKAEPSSKPKKEAGIHFPREAGEIISGPLEAEIGIDMQKINLLMDIPLKVTVILGRTKKPVKEVLSLTPGSIVELTSLVDEPIEILINDTLVAKGEVVVVDENFGVRIISIISPTERVQYLTK